MKKRLLVTLLSATICLAEVMTVSATNVTDPMDCVQQVTEDEGLVETIEAELAEDMAETEDMDQNEVEAETSSESAQDEQLAAETANEAFLLDIPERIEEGVEYKLKYYVTSNTPGHIKVVNKATQNTEFEQFIKAQTFDEALKECYYTISKDALTAGDYTVYGWSGDMNFEAASAIPDKVQSKDMVVRKSLLAEHNKNMSAVKIENAVYTGSAVLPTVVLTETVDEKTYTLVKDKDFKITVTSENKKMMGAAKIKIEGIGEYAGVAEAVFDIAPKTPVFTNVASASASSVKLTWNKSDYADGYYIDRKAEGGEFVNVAKIADADTVTFTDNTTGIAVGETYSYRICSYASSKVESGKEALSTPDENGVSVRVIPATPEVVALDSYSTKKQKLTWKKVEDADGYLISTVKDGKWITLKDINNVNKTSYKIGKLQTGLVYKYKVASYKKNAAGKAIVSLESPVKKARVTVGTPTLVSVKSITSTENEITWKKTSGAYGYYILRKEATVKDAKFKKIGTVSNGSTVTYRDKKALTGKKYVYTVRAYTKATVNHVTKLLKGAYDENGVSCIAVPAKTVFTLQQNEKGVLISIANSQGATGYYLYRKKGNDNWIKRDVPAQGGDLTIYLDRDITAASEYQYYIVPYTKLPSAIVRGTASDTIKFKTK